MNYKKISSENQLIYQIKLLYLSAFPKNERRDFDKVIEILKYNNLFNIFVATDDQNNFCGFISYWEWNDFIYIEHFAVEPELRGNKIGEKMINHFKEINNKPIILEVEPPTCEIAQRRINFYLRCNFILNSNVEYMQPPYSKGEDFFKLILMSYGKLDLYNSCPIIRQIHKDVYGVNYN
ncbi:MAG: GNAT family N-acetyltransferase [Muribaculaceae bacterium]|nr:GNAT family N-acetyltransferase [Muribaculaceae bacterium]